MPGDNKYDHKGRTWIRTYSGGKFSLYGDDPEEIQIEDIAHALSNQCRYTGHVIKFYSVAEHCVMVSKIVEKLDGTKEEVKSALLHDASEAYLSDIAAPIKPEIAGYYEIEALVEARIYKKFMLEGKSELIKRADWYALFIEADKLINSDLVDWVNYDIYYEKAMELDMEPYCWIPPYAKVAFLDRYKELFK